MERDGNYAPLEEGPRVKAGYRAIVEAEMVRAPGRIGLVRIDVDDFKGVNDAEGYDLGDAYLGTIDDVMMAHMRQYEDPNSNTPTADLLLADGWVYRDHGDESYALLRNVTSQEDVDAFIVRIQHVLENDYGISVSMGGRVHRPDKDDVWTLFRDADRMMRQNKHQRVIDEYNLTDEEVAEFEGRIARALGYVGTDSLRKADKILRAYAWQREQQRQQRTTIRRIGALGAAGYTSEGVA